MTQGCDAVVLFGASGDLAKREIVPALYTLAAQGRLDMPVIGVAGSDWTDDDFRDHARAGLDEFGPPTLDDAAVEKLLATMRFVAGDYNSADTFTRLHETLGGATRPLLYLAIPPTLFTPVVDALATQGLHHGARVVVEKPFGRDLRSARELNERLRSTFPEEAIFRIDHFLGKQAVLDLLVFRFANLFLEPVWNCRYIAEIQITMAEGFGVDGRGGFYDGVGAVRDVVQNHLLQVLTLVTMEPPAAIDAGTLREEKAKVLRAVRALTPDDVVFGQYDGYRELDGVDPDSTTETYAALHTSIDNWRWAGVPIFIRAGKKLATTATEVLVTFKEVPRLLFTEAGAPPPSPNSLRFRLHPDERFALQAQINRPGETLISDSVELAYNHSHSPGAKQPAGAYVRLLQAALEYDPTLFASQEGIEHAWRVVDPVIGAGVPVHGYPPGSWGPAAADALVAGPSGWHTPDTRAR